MIDLDDIQEALSDIKKEVSVEHKFYIGKTLIVLAPLSSTDDCEVVEFAQSAFDGLEEKDITQADQVRYLTQFILAILSRSCVQFGNLNLRDETEINTGKTLENGVPEKVPRHVALRGILEKYPKKTLDLIYDQFTKLLEIYEVGSQDMIKWEPSDLEAEVDRIESRIQYVQIQVENKKNPPPNILDRLHKAAQTLAEIVVESKAEAMGLQQVEPSDEPVEEPVDSKIEEPVEIPTEPSKPVERVVAPPPQRAAAPPPQRAAAPPPQRAAAPPPQREAAPPPQQQAAEAPKETDEERFFRENPDVPRQDRGLYTQTGSSMLGENMEDEIEREGQRLAILEQDRLRKRNAALLKHQQLASQPQPSPLPHQGARDVAVEVEKAGFITEGLPPGIDEAYSFPTETLSDRQMVEPQQSQRLAVDQVSRGSTNPRFKGGKRVRDT